MYNKTIADYILDTKDNVVAAVSKNLLQIVAAVFLLSLAPWGRRRWMHLLHSIIFIKSIVITVGMMLGAHVMWDKIENLDKNHVLLGRMVAVLLLVRVMYYWQMCKSTDNTVQTTLVWTTALSFACMLLAWGYTCTHPSKKVNALALNEEIMQAGFLIFVLITLISLFYSLTSTEWGGYGEISSHANIHLRLEFVFLLVQGLIMYTLPQVPIKVMLGATSLDPIHAYLMRCAGSILMGMSLVALRAANFLRQNDKDRVLVTNLLLYVVMALVSWYSLYNNRSKIRYEYAGLQVLFNIVLLMNAFGALDRDVTCFSRTIVQRAKQVPADIRSCMQSKSF